MNRVVRVEVGAWLTPAVYGSARSRLVTVLLLIAIWLGWMSPLTSMPTSTYEIVLPVMLPPELSVPKSSTKIPTVFTAGMTAPVLGPVIVLPVMSRLVFP